jgi:hypothetical protein
MTLAGNHLHNHQQTFGLQELQSPEYLVAPFMVFAIAASAGDLEAAVASSELLQ